ncbi:MAG: DsbA family protein [Candidatus Pacebacteria bacterium]|nr:DsbA family protein [Candidatus Paceibacterota bacterium]
MSEETKNTQTSASWLADNKIIVVILAAAILIAGSLVFLGIRLGNSGGGNASGMSFAEQLAEYEAQQQQAQLEAQAEQERLAQEQAKGVLPPNDDDHILGERDALISIIEYSDFECPFCKRFAETPKQAIAANPGVVNSVFRHFPLGFHDPEATNAALATECAADQGKFWEYHDLYFERTNSNKQIPAGEIQRIAEDIDLNMSEFNSCYDSRRHIDKVQEDIASGAEAGVTGTPGNIIRNNETGEVRFLPGAYPIEAIQAAIDELQ